MSLAEFAVAMGVMSVVSLGVSRMIQNHVARNVHAEREKNYLVDANAVHNFLARPPHAATNSCLSYLTLVGGKLNLQGATAVEVKTNGEVIKDNYVSSSGYKINKIYVDNVAAVKSSSDDKVYQASLYLEAGLKEGSSWRYMPRVSLGSLAVSVDRARRMLDCNMEVPAAPNKDACGDLAGMIWVEDTAKCFQDILRDSDGVFKVCSDGFQRKPADGSCVPVNSTCGASTQLPRSVNDGRVSTCTGLGARYKILHDAGFSIVATQTPGGYPGNGGHHSGGGTPGGGR